jgi:hypothetical protein
VSHFKILIAKSFFITGSKGSPTVRPYVDNPEKSTQGTPLVRVLTNLLTSNPNTVSLRDGDGNKYLGIKHGENLTDVPANNYEIYVDGTPIKAKYDLKLGGVYTFVIQEKTPKNYVRQLITISMEFYLLPQYVIMTLGEVRSFHIESIDEV